MSKTFVIHEDFDPIRFAIAIKNNLYTKIADDKGKAIYVDGTQLYLINSIYEKEE